MTDLAHFDDLTKINVPFGLLDPETQQRLKDSGGPWERFVGNHWREVSDEPHQFGRWAAHRLKPQPPTKPRIGNGTRADWERYLPPWAEWVAVDGLSTCSFEAFESKPYIDGHHWTFARGEVWAFPRSMHCFFRGTCDWRDSLVRKPEQ